MAYGQEFKCPDKTGYFPDPYQCDLYYKCSKGIPEAKLCPDGLVFKDGDPNRERCDIPSNVNCGDRIDLRKYLLTLFNFVPGRTIMLFIVFEKRFNHQ